VLQSAQRGEGAAVADEIMKSIRFSSPTSPPALELPVNIGDFLRKAGSAAYCHPTLEGTLLGGLCTFLGTIGRVEDGESGLGGLLARAYAEMAISPSFMLTGSAVPFCLSPELEGGHYFLHVPRGADSSTPVLLLLHGYGGNLLYFPWAIWKEIPEAILIAPSWQVNWSEGTFLNRRRYVEATLAHASKKTGISLQDPWLVPLSQGGPMAFKLASTKPRRFSGLLGISTFAECMQDIAHLDPVFPVRLLHGDHDARVPFRSACDTVNTIKQSGGDANITAIKGANHFLLLSHREKLREFLRGNI
jgi:predicted esterase